MVRCLISVFAMVAVSCTVTEVPLSHDNPLDSIYDSGDFRLGLTTQAKSNLTSLSWSNVYHKLEGALSDSNLKLNPNAIVLRSLTAPSAGEISSVKSSAALPASTAFVQVTTTSPALCLIAVSGASYAGTCDVPAISGAYYIIQFNYKFTNKSGTVTSGILYSNFETSQ